MLDRPGLREDTGQVRGDEKDPFPIFGTLYAVRGLVRFGRRDSKSTVLRPDILMGGPEPERANEAPVSYGRGSGGRTETPERKGAQGARGQGSQGSESVVRIPLQRGKRRANRVRAGDGCGGENLPLG